MGEIELILSSTPEYNASQNLNIGIRWATGKYVKYLSDDDMLTPNSIRDSVYAMETQQADFLHGRALNRFPSHEVEYEPPYRDPSLEQMLEACRTHGGTNFYRRELFEKFKFDESLWCAEEYDLHLNLKKNGYKFGYCDDVTYIYRRHKDQKSLGNVSKEYQDKRAAQVKMIQNRYR